MARSQQHDTAIYYIYLSKGWQLIPCCAATLLALEKPDKCNRTFPRTFCLILLLFFFRKALEQAIIRRLSRLAIKPQTLPKQYFGDRPARFTTNTTTLLTHVIVEAFAWNKHLSMVTFDIKGVFNTLLPNCLLQCLIRQSWPSHIIRLVALFFLNNFTHICLDKQLETHSPRPAAYLKASQSCQFYFHLI